MNLFLVLFQLNWLQISKDSRFTVLWLFKFHTNTNNFFVVPSSLFFFCVLHKHCIEITENLRNAYLELCLFINRKNLAHNRLWLNNTNAPNFFIPLFFVCFSKILLFSIVFVSMFRAIWINREQNACTMNNETEMTELSDFRMTTMKYIGNDKKKTMLIYIGWIRANAKMAKIVWGHLICINDCDIIDVDFRILCRQLPR